MTTIRTAALISVCVLLSGCGDCNMLSGRMPAHCEALLGAVAVGAAPVLIPMAISDDMAARNAPRKPVGKFVPQNERQRELYQAATGSAHAYPASR